MERISSSVCAASGISRQDDEVAEEPKDIREVKSWGEYRENPYNWSSRSKILQVCMISSAAFTAAIGAPVMSSAHSELMHNFQVGSTVAILPLSLYVFALGLGPVIGGPLSETIGRHPVYLGTLVLGALFSVGAGCSQNFLSLCILRFLSGFCFAPVLAIAPATINEIYVPEERGLPSTVLILCPFLGSAFGPVLGGFIVHRKDWRWTQWTLIFFAIFSLLLTFVTRETFHAVIRSRLDKRLNTLSSPTSKSPSSLAGQIKSFARSTLMRPITMLFTEPIVAFVCLYIACEFATLFSFFAGIPLVFKEVYQFGIEESGLIFLAIVIGCFLGALTIILCDRLFYHRKRVQYLRQSQSVPPELRLYPSLMGSLALPAGLFWFAWTSRSDISYICPAAGTLVFAWGNICIFISTTQYIVDSYSASVVASAMSANSAARYGFAAVFPLFTIQMYNTMGLSWASSLLGFIALALVPIPWLFFFKGNHLRASSKLTAESCETRELPRQ